MTRTLQILRLGRRLSRLSLLFVMALLFCLAIHAMPIALPGAIAQSAPSQSSSPSQQVQQGIEQYQVGQFESAIKLWQEALSQPLSPQDRAIVYTNLAQAYRQVGKLDQTIFSWDQAIQIYQTEKTSDSQVQRIKALIEQAQVYSDLGQHQRAIEQLQTTLGLARKISDRSLETATQGSLGNAYWAAGEYDDALQAQRESLNLARELNAPIDISTALNNLGNAYASRAERYAYQAESARLEGDSATASQLAQRLAADVRSAQYAYQQSVEVSRSIGGLAEIRALLNQNRLLAKLIAQNTAPDDAPNTIIQNRLKMQTLLKAEPDSQDKAYLLIGLANSLLQEGTRQRELPQIASLLQTALQVAQKNADKRTESFALGGLGQVYELQADYETALKLTRQAQFAAQQVNAADSLYRWQWQIGRLLGAKGDIQPAIAAYEQAIATLQTLRSDIITANQDLQFDFRDSVEPVYRQMIGLLLDHQEVALSSQSASSLVANSNLTTQNPKPKTLSPAPFYSSLFSLSTSASPHPLISASPLPTNTISRALSILELLKLAELRNFFGDDCVQVAQAIVDQERSTVSKNALEVADPEAAVIYSVVLGDRTALLLRLPDGSFKSYRIERTAEQLEKEVNTLRDKLERRATDEYFVYAQRLYQLLITPMEADLASAKPRTLVFVNDGVLRKVPMAALYDGSQFLIQKYPIATTPSLSLTTRQPFDRHNLNALILGLTVAQPPFSALTNVATEAKAVQQILGGTQLLDTAFTLEDVRSYIQKSTYPIVHMATHGKFGADATSTFLLGYQSRITIKQLDTVLRARQTLQPVELLTLSACQTAAGDNRSALGIAGVAVRAGVKSAVATLWFINDQATVPLIKEFYTQLRQPGVTKAEALQRAQIKLIQDEEYLEYNHPAVWSPFVLIGNWL
ncbi:MAG: CHAT domain-containing protein [Scytolyngbya sp. HA4215-MV1]|nr:CHAT domain-containing protein [Scytolyngbya sp. HA4215-MV1]